MPWFRANRGFEPRRLHHLLKEKNEKFNVHLIKSWRMPVGLHPPMGRLCSGQTHPTHRYREPTLTTPCRQDFFFPLPVLTGRGCRLNWRKPIQAEGEGQQQAQSQLLPLTLGPIASRNRPLPSPRASAAHRERANKA
jgi:hypothetical protein